MPSWEWQLAKVRIVSHNDHTYGHTTGMLVFTVIMSVFISNTLWCHTTTLFFTTMRLFFLLSFFFCICQYIFWCLVAKAYKNHSWKQQKLTEDFHTSKMSFLTHSLSKVLATSTRRELDLLTFVWHTKYWKFMTLTSKLLVFLYYNCMMPQGKKLDLHTGKHGVSASQTLKFLKLISFST